MADIDPKTPGTARSHGISWNELMKKDSRAAPEFMSEDSYTYRGSEPLATARYTSAEFAQLEKERMWPFVWQFAAREEDIPEAGDYTIFENSGRNYLISRQDDGSVKALHNVCLHRGRNLRDQDGTADQFVCPFHGFTWNKDGSFDQMPCKWDFQHLTKNKMNLPEAEVARWGGYIFIREESGGPSIEEYLAPLPEHFKQWRHEDCTTVIWVAKVVPANWKAVMEAFMEAWHTIVTHPQLLAFTGDCNAAYRTWGDNINVNLVPFGVMSPHLEGTDKPEQWIVDEFVKYNGRSGDNYAEDPFAVTVPDGTTARAALGVAMREAYTKATGYDHSNVTDAELLDGLVYNVFPNFAPWGGFMPNIVYRWREWGDPDHALMEVRILSRVPKGQPIPRGVPMKMIPADQPWSSCPELGVLGDVFDQDMENLPQVQKGMHNSKTGQINLGDYQEIRIRQFHQTLDKYISGELGGHKG